MSKKENDIPTGLTKKSILDQQNMVHAMSYFPYFIGAALMYFLGNTDKKKAMHHIKYSLMLSAGALILIIILNGFFATVANIGYLTLSAFFAYKAFNGQEVEVEFLDVIEDKITETIRKK